MIYLAYCSSATDLMSGAQLAELLRICRRNNEARGISGMLLYRDGSFMQVLEGDEDAVKETYKRIQLDPRHRSLIKVAGGPIEQRSFGEWSMAFVEAEALTEADRAAYSRFLEEPAADVSNAAGSGTSRALKLLQGFRTLVR